MNLEAYENQLEHGRHLAARSVRGRYAPSPTGPLHLGNIRTALLAWLQTRLAAGQFILRMEDLDQPRVKIGSAERILYELRWLGIDWDEGPNLGGPVGPYDQGSRNDFYHAALYELKREGRLFPCFCSRKDIAQAASAPHAPDSKALYPGTCRNTNAEEVELIRRQKGNRIPAWRYRVPNHVITFDDQVAGSISQVLHQEVGDFVVRRADNLFAYQLAVVIDDTLMGITDVVRGADLLASTPRQIELFNALGFRVPQFWHVPLLTNETGERLSKRDGAESIAALRDHGASPEHIVGQLAASVRLVPPGSRLSARELLEELDMETFRRGK